MNNGEETLVFWMLAGFSMKISNGAMSARRLYMGKQSLPNATVLKIRISLLMI